MRGIHSTILACLLSTLLLTNAQAGSLASTDDGDAFPDPDLKRGVDSGEASVSVAASTPQAISTSNSAPSSTPVTETTTLSYVVLGLSSSSSSSLSESGISSTSTSTTSTSTPTTTSIDSLAEVSAGSASVLSSEPAPSTSPDSETELHNHRTLVIILSAVLGFLGLVLILAIFVLAYRFGRGKAPFSPRGASPINDEEIASWRGTVLEHKRQLPPLVHIREQYDINAIGLAHSPGWAWTPSPSNIQSVYSPPAVPDTPSFLARAPNSRAGLTDESVPGADPFITPVKRQSSRLSKAPPGHARTKSRRSSMSAKSMWSFNGRSSYDLKPQQKDKTLTWFDPEDDNIGRELRDLDSSPGTSIFDGLSIGGLSPRPKLQPRLWDSDKEIGRAIA